MNNSVYVYPKCDYKYKTTVPRFIQRQLSVEIAALSMHRAMHDFYSGIPVSRLAGRYIIGLEFET